MAQKDDAAFMPDISGKRILLGFWQNWSSSPGGGYQGGQSADLSLEDIPAGYNVVAVAYMKGSGIPTFQPYNASDAEFRRQVGMLNQQGRAVLISLGGADAHIELTAGQEEALASEIIRLVETYGFDGLNIDLEQSAIDVADNISVIPAALRLVKDHYAEQGQHFIISMTPEFSYLRDGGQCSPYINALEDFYDFIAPQYYNQGGDGVWVDELNQWLPQNDDGRKEDFLYYLTDSLVHGTRGYIRIPADKLTIGLPSNQDAAATGYVIDSAVVYSVFARLNDADQPIKGLMTFSINWDTGRDKHGRDYNWEFISRYSKLIHGESDGEGSTTPPPNLTSPESSNLTSPEWQNNLTYQVQDSVTYQGKQYTCLQAHPSNLSWTPEVAITLWRLAQMG
ncbi:glycosyl hydrolase family 18 protein [Microcoleus sp. MOSTC5]|uniref:carbohydrate-binding protein n=1 Tax=Microcoleus sp. MOSTC5 TaxID=3055378 RepID=UPI002FD69834